jgi:hypothetical protein
LDKGVKAKEKSVVSKNPQRFFCDLAGIRTQDPILKRDVLYQLSYQVGLKMIKKSDLAGIRTQDPILKRDVLYQLSYQVNMLFSISNNPKKTAFF